MSILKRSCAIHVTCCSYLIFVCCFSFSCENYHRNKAHAYVSESNIRKGAKLAAKYCQSCHALPDPSLLDVTSWEDGVLPQMGPLLGIFKHNFRNYPITGNDPNLGKKFYPSKPLLDPQEWQYIIDYYVSTSPDTLPKQTRPEHIQKALPHFKVEMSSFKFDNPAVSFITIDSTSPAHELLLCDVIRQQMFRFNNLLQVIDSAGSSGSIVDMEIHHDKMVACDIGVFNPTNGKFGRGLYFFKDSLHNLKADSQPVFNKLLRPVDLVAADLNSDNRTDYIICEFGHSIGALSWMEAVDGNKFERHEIMPQPGAIKAYVHDYNRDGLSDIWVLFTQGKEGIVLFTNKGNGEFTRREVLSFPAVYGSTYFELCDFNKDGNMDIVYTCGDNADYSFVLKPFHGVYIFLNDGNNNFKQRYFFPINGCFKAIPRDYDNDGDIDIATISFFADYARQPEEGFIYLENKINFQFEPYTFPESQSGRWLTMDAADLDGNGRIDIVLGNFSIRPSAIPSRTDWKKGPLFILLRNTSTNIP